MAGAVVLLSIAAAIEAVTGVGLIFVPAMVVRLLLGADLTGPGAAVARVTGIALLALGLGCAIGIRSSDKAAMLATMLTYNALVAIYLAYLGFGAVLAGVLLWPAVVVHAALAVLFTQAWFRYRQRRIQTVS